VDTADHTEAPPEMQATAVVPVAVPVFLKTAQGLLEVLAHPVKVLAVVMEVTGAEAVPTRAVAVAVELVEPEQTLMASLVELAVTALVQTSPEHL
jgi:hypothetical protein